MSEDQKDFKDQKDKWYNNRAKVIFSFQAFPPLGIYALIRSTAFTAGQKWLVVAGVTAFISLIVWSGIMRPVNKWLMSLFA